MFFEPRTPAPLIKPPLASLGGLPALFPSLSVTFDRQEARRLGQEMERALARGGFALRYIPRFTLIERRLAAFEAQLTWPHRRRGLIPASVFLPLAEQSELIHKLCTWSLREAFATAQRWSEPIPVALRVSIRQLLENRLVGQITEAIEETGFDPRRLEIQISETALLLAQEEALFALAALRDRGVGVLIDEFGADQANLVLLRRLPLSHLKLARSLIGTVLHDEGAAAILEAIALVASRFDLTMVASGLYTEEEEAFLAARGVRQGHGPLFEPLEAALSPALTAPEPRPRRRTPRDAAGPDAAEGDDAEETDAQTAADGAP